jgi:hypothetical protein
MQICGGSARLSAYKLTDFSGITSDLTSGWKEIGCVSEPGSGRLLTGASMTNQAMTPGTCTSFCASKGFSIAGIEWRRFFL